MNKGFTLLEILVTIAIFAIGVLALVKMQLLGVRGTGFNKEATVASLLAQKVIEDFKGASFGSTPADCGIVQAGMTVNCMAGMAGASPFRYNNITVTVTWGIPTKEISLSTGVAEP